ncbi:MAG: DUF3850 domain-containing protein [Candidatus Hodarchaeales archaeon]|jgi:hypothetical protein
MIHHLKTWPVLFRDAVSGAKTFEIRKNDRDFKAGDELLLQEYDPDEQRYTGPEEYVTVSYVVSLDGLPGIPDGFVGMSIEYDP